MNPKTEELLKRTFEFGVKCLLFLESLPKAKVNAVISYQLAKAATSIGSNYEEAQNAESSKDFIHKIAVVLKESRESNYWLRILDAILKKEYTHIDQPVLEGIVGWVWISPSLPGKRSHVVEGKTRSNHQNIHPH